MDYSEAIEVCDIKVGIFSKLNECIEIYMIRDEDNSLTFLQGHSDFVGGWWGDGVG